MIFAGLSEPAIRLIAFSAIFATMAAVELAAPRLERAEMAGAWKSRRWIANVGVLVLSSLCLRFVFPLAAVGSALFAATHGIGLFRLVALPAWLAGGLAFILLDLAVWAEHLANHKIALLWRIHRVHHTDTGVDVTTALRFHPLEIVVSMVWKAAIVILLGPPAVAVLVFEIVLNGAAMFNHANIALPPRVDRLLRTVIVTPDMHRVHHSCEPAETDSNYGFNLSIWDRLFATYVARPGKGHDGMEIGLKTYRGRSTSGLGWLLALPFRR